MATELPPGSRDIYAQGQVLEEVVSSEWALVRHVPKVEKALDHSYGIVESSSESGLDTEDYIRVPKLRRIL